MIENQREKNRETNKLEEQKYKQYNMTLDRVQMKSNQGKFTKDRDQQKRNQGNITKDWLQWKINQETFIKSGNNRRVISEK